MSSSRNHRAGAARLVAARSAPDGGIKSWLIGDSPQMAKVAEDILVAAPDDITVLITGEPGTGKEIAAQAIHHLSGRARGPLVATNCDLKQAIAEGRFRSDLYYRLNWFPIRMPALRERPSDIPLLIEHFLGSTRLEKGGIELLCRYQWPGNVRELIAMIERMKLRAAGKEMISIEQVRREVSPEKTDAPSQYTFVWQPGMPVTEYFAEQFLDIYGIGLALCGGKRSKAARLLGMDRKTLGRRLAQAHRIIDGARGR